MISYQYDIDESLPMLMTTCVKFMREALNMRFEKAGLSVTVEQWVVLIHLWRQDGLTQQDLADRILKSKVAVFNALQKLEKTGLILRSPDPVDGRTNRVYLTPAGKRIQVDLVPIANENIETMSLGVSEQEMILFKEILRKITGNLKG